MTDHALVLPEFLWFSNLGSRDYLVKCAAFYKLLLMDNTRGLERVSPSRWCGLYLHSPARGRSTRGGHTLGDF